MHEDMEQVAERLADAKVDDITIGIEEDIIAALEELIEALQKAQQDMEAAATTAATTAATRPGAAAGRSNRRAEDDQGPAGAGQQADGPLLAALEDDQDPVGQAESADLVDALRKLSERQQDVFRITRDIVLGKNK